MVYETAHMPTQLPAGLMDEEDEQIDVAMRDRVNGRRVDPRKKTAANVKDRISLAPRFAIFEIFDFFEKIEKVF